MLVPTLIAHDYLLCKDDGTSKVEMITYRNIVGKLIFLTNTRPHIVHVFSHFLRYISNPIEEHMKATKMIMTYVKGIIDFCICYYKHDVIKLYGYSESDWGSNLDDINSIFGKYFSLS